MNEIIAAAFGVSVTPWKLIGYLGVLLFAGRWVVQVVATRSRGRPVMPRAFWLMSVGGSGMLLAYFIWGKSDSVGVLSNLFPAAVAVYNLFMDLHASRQDAQDAQDAMGASVDDSMDGHLPSH